MAELGEPYSNMKTTPPSTQLLSSIPPIRARLAWLVFACVAPVIASAALVIMFDFRQNQRALTDDALARSGTTLTAIDREVETLQRVMATMATSPLLAQPDVQRFRTQAAAVQKITGSVNFVLTDPGGQIVFNLQVPEGVRLPMHPDPTLIQRVVDTRLTAISDLIASQPSGRPIVVIAVPVLQDGRVAYVLTGGFSAQALGKVLGQQGLPASWIAEVVDRKGIIAARTHQPERFIGQKTALLKERSQKQPQDVFEGTTLEGVPVITAYMRSAVTGWTVAIGIPRALFTASLWRSALTAAGIAALLLAVMLMLAAAISRRIAGSVAALAKPMQGLSAGMPIAPPPKSYFREAELLGEALTAASHSQQQSSALLAAGKARLEGILDSAMDAIVTADETQRIVLFNVAAVAVFGWTQEEALGKPLDALVPERLRVAHGMLPSQLLQGQDEKQVHNLTQREAEDIGQRLLAGDSPLLAVHKDGHEFPIEASTSVLDQQGQRLYTVILRDITQQVRAREALERSNVELRQFAYVASHDLKGPLRSVGSFMQLLERNYGSRLDARGLDLIHRAVKGARRLEQLTDDLLKLTQLDAEPATLEPVDCGDIMDEVRLLLSDTIEVCGAKVTVGAMPVVLGIQSQLIQLFMNLVANALKYQVAGLTPDVRIKAHPVNGEWHVGVTDNGIGIDPKHFMRIFEVFKRLHTAEEYEGTGLGLALCSRIALRHGGRIWVESELGAGSTFWVSLMPAKPTFTDTATSP